MFMQLCQRLRVAREPAEGENFKELLEFRPIDAATPVCGGITEVKDFANNLVIDDLARFAVDEHNKKQNTLLEFGKVLDAKEQLVAGTLYFITLEATDGGVKKTYEAKVWVKEWENFKELLEFKHVDAANPVCGGITEVKDFANSLVIDDLARFAVDEHNNKQASYISLLFGAGAIHIFKRMNVGSLDLGDFLGIVKSYQEREKLEHRY
ncbi:putative Cystatin domain-containing protein [Helianthus annuus]|nr:putative Cystatin domain-containing protein [Helianthus annuus]